MMRGVLVALGLLGGPAGAAERVMLNQATASDLAALDGVDAPFAEAVVALRATRGRLHSYEELRVLPGATEAALAGLRAGTWVDLELPLQSQRTFATPDEVLAQFAGEPDVAAVQRWAGEQARIQPETVAGWLRASRGFAALPQVRFEYRLRDDFNNDFRAFDLDGNPPTSNDVESVNVLTDADVGQDRTLLVRATWDLDKLIMSSEQIRVINEAQDVVRLREKVLGEVTRVYFERRRLQVDALLDPRPDLVGAVRDQLRLAELTALLDAYTGGRFSAALR